MEVDVNQQTITINRLVSHQNQTVTVEGDMIVPDVKPDILNTIDTTGNVCVYKKEVQDGRVKLDGSIQLNVIYLADTDHDMVRGLTHSLDFSQNINIDDCRTGMDIRNNITIQNIECKVLNGRKMNIKVTLAIEVWIYSNEDINILKEINNMEGIQTLNAHMQINNLIGTGSCRASAKDTIHIDEDDNLAEILKTEVKVLNPEMKVSYHKILLKADANVKIMYLTENGAIKVVSSNIPVMGFVDMNNVSENHLLNSYYEIKNILIQPNAVEQHSIMVEIEFEICCDASDCADIELIQDVYSPTATIQFKQKEVTTMMNQQMNQQICEIAERMSIPEIASHQIYDVEVTPVINQTNILNGRAVYEGNLNLNFIFSSDTSTGINTQAYMLPFTFTVENEQIGNEKIINTRILPIEENFTVGADGMMDCNVRLMFALEMYNNATIHIIDQITMQENTEETSPSMVVYIVKEGDTLWNIAKRYQTTMEDIINVNKLENPDYLSIGQKLFIPRYCAVKIS